VCIGFFVNASLAQDDVWRIQADSGLAREFNNTVIRINTGTIADVSGNENADTLLVRVSEFVADAIPPEL
jgi:hypothetical protein